MTPIVLAQPLTHVVVNVAGGGDYVFIIGRSISVVIYSPNSAKFEALLPPGEYWVIGLRKQGTLFLTGATKVTIEGESTEMNIALRASGKCNIPEIIFTVWIYGSPHVISICNGNVAVTPLQFEAVGEGGLTPLGAPEVKAPRASEYAEEKGRGFPTSLSLLLIVALSASLIAYVVTRKITGFL